MNFRVNELLALALFFTAFLDLYVIPRIMLKNPHKSPEQMHKRIMILKIAGYISIGFGLIFLLGFIRITDY